MVVAMAVFGGVVLWAAPAKGTLITIAIQAVVDGVNDPDNDLEGRIHIGDLITGTYTYDTDSPDMDWLWGSESDIVARYHYFNPPYGISLSVGGLDFKTDPDRTNFVIQIVNDYLYSIDTYSVTSYGNLPLSNGAIVDTISWGLRDDSGSAISSTELLPTGPVLSDWQHFNYLNIEGPGTRDNILFQAHVTSAVVIPEPSAILLLGFGAVTLVRKVRR